MTMPAATPAPAAVPTTAAPTAAQVIQSPPLAAPKAETIRVRSHERAARVKAALDAEPTEAAKSDDVDSGETDETPAAPAKPKAEAAPDAAAEKRRADRAERMRVAQEKERAQDQERIAKSKYTQKAKAADGELETLRKRVAELEPHEAVFKDEESLLAAAEKAGLKAEKLVAWMRKRLEDPNEIAQRQAQTVEEKLQAKLDAMQKRIDQDAADRVAERERAQEQHEAQAKARTFITAAKASKDSHPLTASLQARHGDNGLIAFANQFVAPLLKPGYDLQELHDHVEQLLDEVQVGPNGQLGTPAGASHPAKNGAAKPTTTTLSNGVASERVSVTEEVPLARLPRSERVQRLKERLDSE